MKIIVNFAMQPDRTAIVIDLNGNKYILDTLTIGNSNSFYELKKDFEYFEKPICNLIGTANIQDFSTKQHIEAVSILNQLNGYRLFLVNPEELQSHFNELAK